MSGAAAECMHVAAGRIRFLAAALRGDPARAAHVEHELIHLASVRAVRTHPISGNLVVWFDPAQTGAAELLAVIEPALQAPPVALAERPSPPGAGGAIARLVVGGVALAVLAVRRLLLRHPPLLSGRSSTVASVVTLVTGYPFFRGAARSLTRRSPGGTDALVTAATVASLLLRENVVALTVLWLLNIGEFLQELTLRRTRRAIQDLLSLGDETVWVVVGGEGAGVEVQAALASVAAGDVVAVYAPCTLPVDGEVVSGEAVVGEAAVTGESMPVYKSPGAEVFAGTLLQSGSLRVRATRTGRDTAVGRIIQRVEVAQADRAPIQTVASTFSRRFVPTSFALAGLTWLVTRDAARAMTMLLIACPCAAGLSTPTAISAAIGNGARRGILIKGGTHLESAGRVSAVVLDKTGTLTVGRPLVTSVVVTGGEGWTPEQVLAYAASSEIHVRHPLAEAVVRHTAECRIEIPVHEECEVLLGQGVRADLHGNRLLVGSPQLLADDGVEMTAPATEWLERMRAAGEIVICLAQNRVLVGLIGVTDTVRPESAQVLSELRALGVRRIVMLTGDAPGTAAAVAAKLGIEEWHAQVLPEDKLAVVRRLQEEGHVVAMVGDGTNDAPALALADVGIAMGLGGTDVAVETADVALAASRLTEVASVLRLGRHTLRVIGQNYGLAIGVNSLGLVAGALGRLNPVIAAVLHNASSVAVVVNSSRLTRWEEGHA
ncbi:MAG TPA: cation-translocating P-type ATPase [Candidatus Dormibacteraeota bacterium]|nr:cation-translocating P-type ATPase [Candidatus Dormibacteraeota bacterium]